MTVAVCVTATPLALSSALAAMVKITGLPGGVPGGALTARVKGATADAMRDDGTVPRPRAPAMDAGPLLVREMLTAERAELPRFARLKLRVAVLPIARSMVCEAGVNWSPITRKEVPDDAEPLLADAVAVTWKAPASEGRGRYWTE